VIRPSEELLRVNHALERAAADGQAELIYVSGGWTAKETLASPEPARPETSVPPEWRRIATKYKAASPAFGELATCERADRWSSSG